MPTREELIAAIQSELATRQNPNRVTTREQALANAEGVDGSLESGPWYMDFAKDVLNPVDAAAGLATGGMKAAGQGVRSLAKGAVDGAVGGAAERQSVINLVNDGAGLAPKAKELATQAARGITENGIKPKEAALRELVQGKTGQINPDVVAEVFPNYAKKLAERRAPETIIGPLGESIQTAGTSGPVEIPLERFLRIKRGADSAAGYSKTAAPFQEGAAIKNANAKRLGDVARTQIYENAPGSQQVLADMGKDIKLKQFLTKKSNSDPVSLLKSKPGTMRDSLLAQTDNIAGSNLRGYGEKIRDAVDLQMNPKNLVNPLGVAPEVRKMATRAAIKTGSGIHAAAEGTGKVLGAAGVPEAVGYAGAREVTEGMLPSEPSAPQPTGVDRSQLIQQIQAELARRQSP